MSSHKKSGRLALIGGLAAATLACGPGAQAAILYDFKWFSDDGADAELWGAFQFKTPDFIDAGVDVAPSDLDECSVSFAASACGVQTLDADSTNYDEEGYDVVVFRYDQAVASRLRPIVHFFEDGALGKTRVHEQILSDYISVLTVTVVPDAVPEPGTWALMILGFGLAGSRLRQRRAATAA